MVGRCHPSKGERVSNRRRHRRISAGWTRIAILPPVREPAAGWPNLTDGRYPAAVRRSGRRWGRGGRTRRTLHPEATASEDGRWAAGRETRTVDLVDGMPQRSRRTGRGRLVSVQALPGCAGPCRSVGVLSSGAMNPGRTCRREPNRSCRRFRRGFRNQALLSPDTFSPSL